MASVRRTKNFALDGQTPMFLYSILKQLDLRSIDWNLVAESLDISNGHAARMRYSRMRTQFEAMSKDAKPPKPKKDNEAKAAKEKAAKSKRALLEEETERLGTGKQAVRASGQENIHKRPKLGQYGSNPWVSTVMPGQQYTNSFWPHPNSSIKDEPTNGNSSSTTTTPLIKKDPELSETSTTTNINMSTSTGTRIKQEKTVKEEPKTNDVLQESPPVPSIEDKNEVAAIAMKQDPSYSPTAYYYPSYRYGTVPGTYQPQNAAGYYQTFPMPPGPSTYPMQQTYAYNPWIAPRQSINPWSHSAMGPIAASAAPTAVNENVMDHVSLNPHASSYEDLLNMPLYSGTPQNFQFDVATPEPPVEAQTVAGNMVDAPAQNAVAVTVEPPSASFVGLQAEKEKFSSPPVRAASKDAAPEKPAQHNVVEANAFAEQSKNSTELALVSGVGSDVRISAYPVVAGDRTSTDNEVDAEHEIDDEQTTHVATITTATTTTLVAEADKESKVVMKPVVAVAIDVEEPKVVIKSEPVEILDP
ncbi:hypothetical protein PV08_10135 [Exophiala spinifera]|uniref:Myb-like DNA-binding domain-containing protein n=1 Tax=Exophiala spinifera TaxID=91928 RepID=A0A0D1Y7F1_9EURO|nr:uncharacterized protein PV08_10135 [Exophiala spinifera]KIW10836.1 hypothetical protein PV08_10135 [Exophiala spinifera]